jgi:hypothetical protein
LNKTALYIGFILLAFGISCINRDDYKRVPESVLGYRPIYFDSTVDINTLIYSTTPRPIKTSGKIYLYQKYLFIGEPALGVHVFDNSNPNSPVPFCFINITYNYDIAIKDSILYADTYFGIVAINIAHLPNVKVVQHIRGAVKTPPLPGSVSFASWSGRSRNFKTYFECIDPSRGTIVAWFRDTLKKPKCYQ